MFAVRQGMTDGARRSLVKVGSGNGCRTILALIGIQKMRVAVVHGMYPQQSENYMINGARRSLVRADSGNGYKTILTLIGIQSYESLRQREWPVAHGM